VVRSKRRTAGLTRTGLAPSVSASSRSYATTVSHLPAPRRSRAEWPLLSPASE
jgi:hypothetical protein